VLVIFKEYLGQQSTIFYKRCAHNLQIGICHRKHLAEHWDLPNTGIFYSKDIASEFSSTVGPAVSIQYIRYHSVSDVLVPVN
jgi:hypothetical protein